VYPGKADVSDGAICRFAFFIVQIVSSKRRINTIGGTLENKQAFQGTSL